MRRRQRERGSVAVEFALIFPVVVLVIFGIIQYGYQYWAMSQASAIAREVARLAIVNTQWSCGETWGVRQARSANIGATAPTVTRTFPGGGGPGASGVVPEGTRIRVTVQLQSLDLGFLPVPADGKIVESADARVEYAPNALSGGETPQPCPAEYQ